jgi:DNA-binding NtrC family response regulator
LIEEVDELSPATLQAAYQQAREWLSSSQSQEIKLRLGDAAGKVTASVSVELSTEEATEILLTKPCDLQERILKYEGALIKEALAQANGRVTHAASLLGMSYQALCYIIEARHKNLLKERSPVRRRRPRKEPDETSET